MWAGKRSENGRVKGWLVDAGPWAAKMATRDETFGKVDVMNLDLSLALQELLHDAILVLPQLILAIIIFGVTLIASSVVARWVRGMLERRIEEPEIIGLLARLARWIVIVVGLLVALEQVNFDVTTFVAGLGVTGLTIGFALQDIARNFVAGLIMLIRKPFRVGQAVQVAGQAGVVEDLNSRDTVVRTWDGESVIIPNLDVLSGAITNYSDADKRRRTIYLGVGYGQDLRRAREVFLEATRGVTGVAEEPAPMLHAEALGDSSVTYALRFWVDLEAGGLLDVHSDVVVALIEAAEREGIELPYPIQTVRLERVPAAAADGA